MEDKQPGKFTAKELTELTKEILKPRADPDLYLKSEAKWRKAFLKKVYKSWQKEFEKDQ